MLFARSKISSVRVTGIWDADLHHRYCGMHQKPRADVSSGSVSLSGAGSDHACTWPADSSSLARRLTLHPAGRLSCSLNTICIPTCMCSSMQQHLRGAGPLQGICRRRSGDGGEAGRVHRPAAAAALQRCRRAGLVRMFCRTQSCPTGRFSPNWQLISRCNAARSVGAVLLTAKVCSEGDV